GFYAHQFAREGGIGPIGTGNVVINPFNSQQIVAKSDGRCLAVPEGTLANTIQIVQQPCDPVAIPSTYLVYHDRRPEDYRIVNRQSEKCLNVRYGSMDNSAPVDQYDCQYPQQWNDAWRIRYVSGAHNPVLEIVSAGSGKCLDVYQDRLTQYDCH